MRLEAQAVKTRPPRRPLEMDRIKKASRLESTVTKLSVSAKKAPPRNNSVQISIGTWKSKPKTNISSGNTTKIKSELCPVTETCTAATLPTATPSTPNHKHRVKAEKTVSLSTANLPIAAPSVAKTLPITPTIARIKRDNNHGVPGSNPNEFQSSTSLISPDMQRVKVEIGHNPFNYRTTPPAEIPRLPTLPTSPVQIQGSPDFISPRKRSMMSYEGSPVTKRHRMSTDSRGSSSEGGGAGSPSLGASPPRHNNGGRVSSFSIDSIMSSSPSPAPPTAPVGGGGTVHRPVPIPASPARGVSDPREHKSPTPSTPLCVPITPYSARNTPQSLGGGAMQINPYLAHLAGVAANPSLGLSPSASYTQQAVMLQNQYSILAAHAMMARQAIATPPTSINGRNSSSRQSSGNASSPPLQASTPNNRPYSPFAQQYRGEPKVATPTPKATPMEIPTRLVPTESGGNHKYFYIII